MPPTDDEKRRAFAVLEIAPDAGPAEIRRAYRRLVRRWHPDRFANDPQGRAEATERLRVINRAYEVVSNGTLPPPVARFGWTREAIEGTIRAIGEESAFQALGRFLFWAWPLFLAFFISRDRYARLRDILEGRPPSPIPYYQAALVALSAILYLGQRRRRS